jgi:predicted CopG family antitoxin
MAESATVRVSEETKERLQRRKRNDESFNDVITRLLDECSQQRIDELSHSRDNEET